ncbi:hypothetical protein MNBD_GAMMA12-885 [hydrothermal vent metagenome]|uniref:Uncharacterized protein n=1 Tax=hydrothermal vent metagenome TaxID=652676 RepID=A0A3B0Y8J8_9ZZZZ
MGEIDLSKLKFHGIEIPAKDCNGRFHFAILKLFQTVYYEYCFPNLNGRKPPPDWPHKWFDRKFPQGIEKFSDTFNKIRLVAQLIKNEKENVYENNKLDIKKERINFGKPSKSLDIHLKCHHALQIIPVHLDSLFFYTRIIADCIADLTPYLYPKSEGQQIANRSFRDHRKWFQKNREYDKEYASILTENTQWFDLLAGKAAKEGLRDKIIHHRGVFQLVYTTTVVEKDFSISAGITGDAGYIIDDIFPEIVSIILELFIYFDLFVSHFNQRLQNSLGVNIFDLQNPFHTELYRCNESSGSLWLFPQLSKEAK